MGNHECRWVTSGELLDARGLQVMGCVGCAEDEVAEVEACVGTEMTYSISYPDPERGEIAMISREFTPEEFLADRREWLEKVKRAKAEPTGGGPSLFSNRDWKDRPKEARPNG